MVACARNLHFAAVGTDDRIWWRIGNSSVYLYAVLMKGKHPETIMVFVLVLVIVFLFYRNMYLLYTALGLGCIGLFIPSLSSKLHWLWMKFAEGLGYVMNRIILSIVFFIFLVPVAFLSKLFRKNPFKAGSRQVKSYFTERNLTYSKKNLEDIW